MRYLLLLCLTVLWMSALHAGEKEDVLNRLPELVNGGRYADAYQSLEQLDPANKDTDIFLTKLNFALNYYIVALQHQLFGFANVTPGQDIKALRGAAGEYQLYRLDANAILDSLIKVDPLDTRLYKAQVDYLYECYLNYGDNMPFTQEELLSRLEKAATQSIVLKSADFETYFILGYLLLIREKPDEAQKLLKTSIEMNPGYPPAYYNLSYAQFSLKDYKSSLSNALKAWSLYTNKTQKADVARMLSFGYDHLGKTDSALYYLKEGLKLDSGNYALLEDYLYIAIREKLPEKEKIQLELILLDPENPAVYNSVINAYYEQGDSYGDVLKTLDQLESVYRGNDKVMGNLCFYKGQLLFETDIAAARESFTAAKSYFGKIYPAEHEVFKVINQYLTYEEPLKD